jgi:hypothetical protein
LPTGWKRSTTSNTNGDALTHQAGALKIADKFTIAMEAVGNKIRLNCQGWEDVKVLGERQVLMVVAIKGELYLLPEARPSAQRSRLPDHDAQTR